MIWMKQMNKILNEKLLTINVKSANEGKIVILAGGAGAGKTFSIKNFTNITDSFKTLNIDQIIEDILKTKIIFEKFKNYLSDIKSPYADYTDYELRHNPHLFKDQHFLDTLYDFIIKNNYPMNKLKLLLMHSNPKRLPNLAFDTTFSHVEFIKNKIEMIEEYGYKPENVNVVWVLTPLKQNIKNNLKRNRTIDIKYVKESYKKSVKNLMDLIFGSSPITNAIQGNIWVILNKKEYTSFYPNSNVISDFKYLQLKSKSGPIKSNIKLLLDYIEKNGMNIS